jgi:hypothetical protein
MEIDYENDSNNNNHNKTVNDNLPIKILFYFLPVFNIVTVELLNTNKNNNNNVFNTDYLLSNLFFEQASLNFDLKSNINKSLSKIYT